MLARVSAVAANPNNAVPAVKAALRSYRANESAARDLISTVWNITDRNLEGTASVVNGTIEFLDDEDKKRDMLQAWNGFKIEVCLSEASAISVTNEVVQQRNQFPELVPAGTGSEWAGITGGRILNAKQSTATRSQGQSSRQLLDRVARAAGSSSGPSTSGPGRATATAASTVNNFPPLAPSTGPAPGSGTTGFRQGPRKTPWSASSSSSSPAASSTPMFRAPVSVPGPGARSKAAPPKLSHDAFPTLPTSTAAKVPRNAIGGNQSLRNILGDSTPSTAAWGSSGKSDEASAPTTPPA